MARINGNWPWPSDVGLRGTYNEEIKQLQKLEKNPDASPVPALAPSNFISPSRTSEDLRVGDPELPLVRDDPESPQLTLTHIVLRRLLLKRRRKGWKLFQEAVQDEPLGNLPEGRRKQMQSMLNRERAMLEKLAHYNGLAEDVYARLLSEAKG